MENKINNEIDDNVEVKTKETPKKKSKIFFIAGGVLFIIAILAIILGLIFASAIEPIEPEVQPEIPTQAEYGEDDFQKKYEEAQKDFEKQKEQIQSEQKQIEQKSKEIEKKVESVKDSMDSPQETQKKVSNIQKETQKQKEVVEKVQEEFEDAIDALEDSSEESTQSLLDLE